MERLICNNCGAPLDLANDSQIRLSIDGRALICSSCNTYCKVSKSLLKAFKTLRSEFFETPSDCLKAIDKVFMNNDRYRSVLSSIVNYISIKEDFSIAYNVLKKIDRHEMNDMKTEIALYFIEKMQDIIDKKIIPKSSFGLHYTSSNWGKGFKNDDYVKYRDIALKYRKRGGL